MFLGGRKEVHLPLPILMYNNYMGGVDQADQIGSYYTVGRSSVKWLRYICWWLLQTAMVKAFIIFRTTNRPAPSVRGFRHINFRLDVLHALSLGNVSRSKEPSQTVSQTGVTAANPMTHVISRMPGSKADCLQCKAANRCTEKNWPVRTVKGCQVCRVHLCGGECFLQFHLKLANN